MKSDAGSSLTAENENTHHDHTASRVICDECGYDLSNEKFEKIRFQVHPMYVTLIKRFTCPKCRKENDIFVKVD